MISLCGSLCALPRVFIFSLELCRFSSSALYTSPLSLAEHTGSKLPPVTRKGGIAQYTQSPVPFFSGPACTIHQSLAQRGRRTRPITQSRVTIRSDVLSKVPTYQKSPTECTAHAHGTPRNSFLHSNEGTTFPVGQCGAGTSLRHTGIVRAQFQAGGKARGVEGPCSWVDRTVSSAGARPKGRTVPLLQTRGRAPLLTALSTDLYRATAEPRAGVTRGGVGRMAAAGGGGDGLGTGGKIRSRRYHQSSARTPYTKTRQQNQQVCVRA